MNESKDEVKKIKEKFIERESNEVKDENLKNERKEEKIVVYEMEDIKEEKNGIEKKVKEE